MRWLFVRESYVQGAAIRVRIHRHAADAHPLRRPHDAAGDLAAVGDQDFPENHFGLRFSRKAAMS